MFLNYSHSNRNLATDVAGAGIKMAQLKHPIIDIGEVEETISKLINDNMKRMVLNLLVIYRQF